MYHTTGFTKSEFNEIVAEVWGVFPEEKRYLLGRPQKLTFRSKIKMTLQYLRLNVSQRFLSEQYDVSQTLVCRVINDFTKKLLDTFQGSLPTMEDLTQRSKKQVLLLDGTLIPCGRHAYHRDLYSGKNRMNGFNIQVISTLSGELVYVSDPLPGKMHDARAIQESGLLNYLDPLNTLADKGYVGTGVITPQRKYAQKDSHKAFNKTINSIRSAVERCIAHLKNRKTLSTRYRKPHHTLKQK